MPKTKNLTILILFTFFIFNSACDVSNSGTVANANSENRSDSAQINTKVQNESDENVVDNAGICANEYYPISEKKREYINSKNSSSNYVLTQQKKDGDSFGETRDFGGGLETTTNWLCTKEGLRNAEYNSGANFSSGNFKMDTLESSGITLPKKWEVGKKWTTEYKIAAKLNAGGASSAAKGTIKINNEIVSMNDKITTKAGEFEAAKVVSKINMNLSVGKPTTMKMTVWYAPEIGFVKQVLDSPYASGLTTEYAGVKD